METEKKYSSQGRVLRPRKKVYAEDGRDGGEHRNYEERRNYGGEHRSFGEHRGSGYGERRSYSDRRPSEGHGGYGDRPRRPYGQDRAYGQDRSYGQDRPNRSQDRLYGGQDRPRQNRPYGHEDRAFSGDRPRRPYGSQDRPYGGPNRRPSYRGPQQQRGGRKPFRKNYLQFTERDEEGINRMLSRKPQVDGTNVTGSIPVPAFQEEIRLNKFIANSGVCSRREADTYIQAGVVTVNGEVVTELGTKVNVLKDEVKFNGERLKGEEKVYIVMNKPKGFVTTASDPHADKTVMDLLKGCSSRVFPVGRLDKATTGVLMFTNDGEMAERLSHPAFNKKKIYQVILDHELAQEDFDKLVAGITLNDGEIKADELEYIDERDHRKLGIEIHSGKNRIVRRMFEALGYEVKALDRVYFAGLTKKGLQKGELRYLSEGEVNILRMGAYV